MMQNDGIWFSEEQVAEMAIFIAGLVKAEISFKSEVCGDGWVIIVTGEY